jgi:hypothetical protein
MKDELSPAIARRGEAELFPRHERACQAPLTRRRAAVSGLASGEDRDDRASIERKQKPVISSTQNQMKTSSLLRSVTNRLAYVIKDVIVHAFSMGIHLPELRRESQRALGKNGGWGMMMAMKASM